MRKNSFLLFVLFVTSILQAQEISTTKNQNKSSNICTPVPSSDNLVLNGNFEQFSEVPSDQGDIALSCGWNSAGGSVDYFHRESTNSIVSIPNNNLGGSQEVNPVYGGDAYAGFVLNQYHEQGFYKEKFKTKLKCPLLPNTEYTLQFDLSKGDRSGSIKAQAYIGGALFANVFGDLPIGSETNGIFLENDTFTTNTTSWDTISFTFTTGDEGGQQYLYFGGISNVQLVNSSELGTYYYVDNVSLKSTIGVDECAGCMTALDTVSIQEGSSCDEYEISIPFGQEENFQYILTNGNEQTILPSGVSTITFTENGSYPITIDVVYIQTNLICNSLSQTIRIDNCDFSTCPDCSDYRTTVFESIREVRGCGNFQINVPESTCYDVILHLDNVPSDPLPTGVSQFSFNSNGLHTYFITVVNSETSEVCLGRPRPIRVEINCCRDCDPQTTETIQTTFWNSLEKDRDTCGKYSFRLPILNDCTEVVVNWGDSNITTYSNTTNIPFEHHYLSDGDYDVCMQVIVNGEVCYRECKRISVRCFGYQCPTDCKDVFDLIIGSLAQTDSCGTYTVNVPEYLLNCYTFILEKNDNTFSPQTLTAGLNTFSYTENGLYDLTLIVFDIDTPNLDCIKDQVPLTVNCSSCESCDAELDTITINQTDCNEFDIVLANPIDDCYILEYHIDGFYQGDITTSTTTVSSVDAGTHTVRFFLYETPYNATGNNCERMVTIDSNCTRQSSIKVFPNPSSTSIKIALSDKEDSVKTIKVKNLYGQVVTQNRNIDEVQVSDLVSGVYYMTVITNSNDIFIEQVIVE